MDEIREKLFGWHEEWEDKWYTRFGVYMILIMIPIVYGITLMCKFLGQGVYLLPWGFFVTCAKLAEGLMQYLYVVAWCFGVGIALGAVLIKIWLRTLSEDDRPADIVYKIVNAFFWIFTVFGSIGLLFIFAAGSDPKGFWYYLRGWGQKVFMMPAWLSMHVVTAAIGVTSIFFVVKWAKENRQRRMMRPRRRR
jgi:hypothetical protein